MATYEQLAHSSYTDVVVPFVSDNGLGVQDSCSTTLTGYTLSNTQFSFTANLSSLQNTYIGASMDKLIWDMGDGTHQLGMTVSKHYSYPGEYEVTTIFTDQNGVTHKNRLSQKIKVYNYIPDSLVWYTEAIADPLGGRPERVMCGVPSDELEVYRMNSWQSWPAVSADGGYYINLYATGSRSRPLTQKQYESNPDSHFIPSWRFLASKDSKKPIERTQTANEYIYVKKQGNDLIRASSEDTSAIFAGTSGRTVVHYLDDSPNRLTSARDEPSDSNAGAILANSNMTDEERELANLGMEDRDMILYASFDTSKFPVTTSDDNITRFELLRKNYFQIYETQKVGLPIAVKYTNPQKLSITTSGIPEPGFQIKGAKFVDSPQPVVIRMCDKTNNIINTDELVPLSSRWIAPTQAFSAGDVTTDVLTAQGFVTVYLSGTDSTFEQLETPYKSEEDFQVWDVGQTFPVNEVNRHVRIMIANRKTKEPIPVDPINHPGRMRILTILFSELSDDQQQILMNTNMSDHLYGSGSARNWILRSGEIHYGYILPKSNYKDTNSIDLQLETVDESFSTPGTLISMANLQTDTLQYKTDKNRYRYFAHTLLKPPETYTYEVVYYYVTNPTNDTIWQIKPIYYREYSYGGDGTTQTYTPPISTRTPGNSGMYGIAVEPLGDVIAVDGDTDKIIRYWRNVTSRAEFSIKDVMPADVAAAHYPVDPDAYGYTPSSVALDRELDYWVTLYDTVSTVKFSGETNLPVACAVPPVVDFMADVRTTNPSGGWDYDATYSINQVGGRPGEYGESIINPAVVETCVNNDIVVTYTNPLCSFIARYDTNGEFKYKYEFPGEDRYFTGDVCVDISDHVWAVTESTGLSFDGVPVDEPISMLYSFDEDLNLRYAVSSLEGTSFQDMLKPAPHGLEQIDFTINMDQVYDYTKQQYLETSMLVEGFGAEQNPRMTVYEGNIYHFNNQYYNNGRHPLEFQYISTEDENLPLSALPEEYAKSAGSIQDNVVGYGTSRTSIYITKDTPKKFLLVDQNFPNTIALIVDVVKKPVIDQRPAETFKYMNNASFLIPDNNNNIWVSWGNRFCSRWNPLRFEFDTTVAVGSAYDDPRYDPKKTSTHERRDNAARRSAIEGLSVDTANNLLVIQNRDKNIYALNSDTPTVSAFINLDINQPEPSEFTWMDSLCSTKKATQDDFLLYPDSYMTKEQIQSFLDNVTFTGTLEQKQQAFFNYYTSVIDSDNPIDYRTSHGANPVHPTGFESEICAIGDWTGYKWIAKYDDRIAPSDQTSGYITLSGASEEFTLLPQTGTHELVKINESHDFAENIRSFMKQPALIENTKLYNEFNDVVFGTQHSSVHSLGKKIYERIANYVTNISDIDTCTIDALQGMAEMVNHNLKTIGYSMPTEIQRLVDMLSVSFTRLRGNKMTEHKNFDKLGNWNQTGTGYNLGPELMFVFDWMYDHGYSTGDFVHHQGKYYECVSVPTDNQKPGLVANNMFWQYVPSGIVRTLTRKHARRDYNKLSPEQKDMYIDFEQYYEKVVPVRARLIQDLRITQDTKYVLVEEHTGAHDLVQGRTVRFEDGKMYNLTLVEPTDDDSYITITNPNPNRPLIGEHLTLMDTHAPLYTQHDDGTLTLIGNNQKSSNMTIVLITNRVYRFEVESIDHPIIITETPGEGAVPTPFVNDQYVEYGKIVIDTAQDSVHGDFPTRLYYQSARDPKISGAILIQAPEQIPGYSTKYDGLTSYNLNLSVSSHEDIDRLGWGMSFPETNNVWQFYTIFEYLSSPPETASFVNNLIDWDSTQTTVKYDLDGSVKDVHDEWYRDDGLADMMIEKTLRKGLGLFDGMDSIK